MDEPTRSLDPAASRSLRNFILDNLKGGARKTILIATHDLHEAAYFADEIILLRAGKIVQRGTITDLLESPQDAFVTQFVNAQRTTVPGGEP